METWRNTGARLAVGVVAISAFLFLLPLVRLYMPTLDEGTYVGGAVRILEGQVPYRDFVEPAGPGSFYWIALWFRISGATFLTARTLLLLTGVALPVVAFLIGCQLGGRGYWAALFVGVSSVPMMIMNSPHYDSNVLVLLAVLAYLRRRYGLAGVCLGCADLCLQGKGIYVGLAFGASLLWRREWKGAIRFGCLWAVPLAAMGLWFRAQHALQDAVEVALLWPLRQYGEANGAPYGFPLTDYLQNWWGLFRPHGLVLGSLLTVLWSLPFVFPAALPFLSPLLSWATRTWSSDRWPVWAAAFGLFAAEFHRHDLGHLMNGTPLLAILFCDACERAAVRWPRLFESVLAFSFGMYALVQSTTALLESGTISGRRGTLNGQSGGAVMTFLEAHTRPGDPLFVYPYRPVFYFWANLRNASRYTLMMYGYNSDTQFRQTVDDLERQQVRYVLWDQNFGPQNARTVFPFYRQPPAGRLIMEPYLTAHYHKIALVEGFSVMERNP